MPRTVDKTSAKKPAQKKAARTKARTTAKATSSASTRATGKTKSRAAVATKRKAGTKAKTPRKATAGTAAKTGTRTAVKAKAKTKAKTRPAAKAKAKARPATKARAGAKAKTRAATKARSPAKAAARQPGKQSAATSRAAGAPAPAGLRNFEPYKPRRGESYMNDEQRDHFRGLLRTWKRELMQEVDRTVSHMKDEAANFPDPADRATQEEEFSLELRARDRERKLIRKIDATLELIDQDEYGYCEACGVEIGIQRLEARPTATLCIDCKTLAEIKERQEMG